MRISALRRSCRGTRMVAPRPRVIPEGRARRKGEYGFANVAARARCGRPAGWPILRQRVRSRAPDAPEGGEARMRRLNWYVGAAQVGLAALVCGQVGHAVAQSAAAGSFPSRAVRVVIALAPGGGVDTTGRLVGQKLGEAWGQQFVAENRPGAGGTIAADLVAKASADGYTLLVTSVGHAISPVFYKQLPYDVHKSFSPIARFVVAPNVIVVHPSVPVKSIKELVAFAKARPGELLFSTSGVGGPQHLTLELF
ncbi:MAG: hypothetical protein EHM59_20110, partial [Betaproteobacteria bacterium]